MIFAVVWSWFLVSAGFALGVWWAGSRRSRVVMKPRMRPVHTFGVGSPGDSEIDYSHTERSEHEGKR